MLGQLIANWTNSAIFAPKEKLFNAHRYDLGQFSFTNIDLMIAIAAVVVAIGLRAGESVSTGPGGTRLGLLPLDGSPDGH